ncbi:hypothetical protein QQ045_026935 [Rhodiola kirilowii]
MEAYKSHLSEMLWNLSRPGKTQFYIPVVCYNRKNDEVLSCRVTKPLVSRCRTTVAARRSAKVFLERFVRDVTMVRILLLGAVDLLVLGLEPGLLKHRRRTFSTEASREAYS